MREEKNTSLVRCMQSAMIFIENVVVTLLPFGHTEACDGIMIDDRSNTSQTTRRTPIALASGPGTNGSHRLGELIGQCSPSVGTIIVTRKTRRLGILEI